MSQTELKYEVRNFIEREGLSVNAFAKKADLSPACVYNWLNNNSNLNGYSIMSIKQAIR